jgi:hypothetical protein
MEPAPVFSPAVERLLTLPRPDWAGSPEDWPDVVAATGVAAEDVPMLVRLATDEFLHTDVALPGDDAAWLAALEGLGEEAWAVPIHAWRALAQLGDPAGLLPLVDLIARIDELDSDWMTEDLPKAIGCFGLAAIAPLAERLLDDGQVDFARMVWSECVNIVGEQGPEERAAAIAALTAALARYAQLDPWVNGSLVDSLVDLKAVEAADLIRDAFAAGAVDVSTNGDWLDAQVELGLIEPTPEYLRGKRERMRRMRGLLPAATEPRAARPDKSKKKAKRKQAKQSRKRNRR